MSSYEDSPRLFGSDFVPQPSQPFDLTYPDDPNFLAISDNVINMLHDCFDLGSGFVGQALTTVHDEVGHVEQAFCAPEQQNHPQTLRWLEPVVCQQSQATDSWSRVNAPCAEPEKSTAVADIVGISNWSTDTIGGTPEKTLQCNSAQWTATVPACAAQSQCKPARSGMKVLSSDPNPSPYSCQFNSAADSSKPNARWCSRKLSERQFTLRRTVSASQDESYSRLQSSEMAKTGSRRDQHSLVEARYREKMNRKLAELRALLPEWSDEERISCKDPVNPDRRILCSKVQILEKAICRITSLQTENATLLRRVALYEHAVEQLRQHIEEDSANKT